MNDTTTATTATSSAGRRLARLGVAALAGVLGVAGLTLAGTQAASATPVTSHSAKTCQWEYAPGGANAPVELGQSKIPLSQLNFGSPYGGNSASIAEQGYVDFDGDGYSDVFAAVPQKHGGYEWQYRSAGVGSWHLLGVHSQSAGNVLLADLDGNGRTDVVVSVKVHGGYQLEYYRDGYGSPHKLAKVSVPLSGMRAGDFDGNGYVDLLDTYTTDHGARTHWQYYRSGYGPAVQLGWSDVPLASLRFGDFDGDGATDVFFPEKIGGGQYRWYYYSSDELVDIQMMASNVAPSALRAGVFGGTGTSDIFTAIRYTPSKAQWQYSADGQDPFSYLDRGQVVSNLRFASFDGDGLTDVFFIDC